MGIGGGQGVAGSAQPPTILETEGQAFHEINKKVLLAMLPADTFEVIPFTDREKQMLWKYDTPPDRPILHPLMDLRMSLEEVDSGTGTWQPIYEGLINQLPTEIKDILISENKKPFLERNLSYVVLDDLLTGVAKAMGWAATASISPTENTPAATQNTLNALLPYIALRGGLDHATNILGDSQNYLANLGANFAIYDVVSNALTEITDSMIEMSRLRAEIEKETIREEVKSDIIRVAHDIGQINPLISRDIGDGEFQILSSLINSLSVVSSAFALDNGSPPLLIGLHIATQGLRTEESGTGVLGSTFSAITDSVVKGLLGSLEFGTGSEINELNGIRGDLYELLD